MQLRTPLNDVNLPMCGVFGIIDLAGRVPVDPSVLARMAQVTNHRGPDDRGWFAKDGAAIGMTRLSIIDLAGGHQPLSNKDETLWLVCNGEIYNFQTLRETLKAKGHVFATRSDSEVVLHAYAEYGEAFIDHIKGMFGFALWDLKKKKIFIGRDRLGIKPLYYARHGDRLVFASELKAMLEVPGFDAAVDPVGLHQYLALGYAPAPVSILKGVKRLPVASMMIVDLQTGTTDVRRYWSLPREVDDHASESDWIERLRETLKTAIESQMVSDVPLGAFLSGGVDSSAIVAYMSKKSSQPVKTYSIGFDTGSAGSFYNELPYAEIVARQYGTSHKEIVVRPDVVELLPKLLWHMDEPIADSAFITTFLVSEFARKDVTVILSGVGGDELFGGYRRYLGEFYGQYYRMVPSALRQRLMVPIARRLPADRHSTLLNVSRLAKNFLLSAELGFEDRYRSYVGVYTDDALRELMLSHPEVPLDALGAAFARSSKNDALRTLFEVDCETQMPEDLLMLTDKMTMATSLECRVPFLDESVVELAARMPSRFKIRGRELKYVLKKALSDLLPNEILYRKKRGFGAPMGAWIKNELAALTDYLLSEDALEKRGLVDPKIVRRTIQLHKESKADHTDHLLALLNLEIWCRMYLDGSTAGDLTAQIKEEARA